MSLAHEPLPQAVRPNPDGAHNLPVAPGAQPSAPRRLHSAELFDGEQLIEIEHGDAVYRLRRTALGKLILTK